MKTVWHNGTFYTMVREGEQVEALLTVNGKIIAMGTYEALKGNADAEVDLNGASSLSRVHRQSYAYNRAW